MWCNKCHWGSDVHIPYKLISGEYICNTCGNTGRVGGKDAQFVENNPVQNDPKSSIHPGRNPKNNKNAKLVVEPAESLAE